MTVLERKAFGHDTTIDEVLKGIELQGRTVLITGGSSGLGAETARAFAAKGAEVIITARNLTKARDLADEIESSTGQQVRVEKLELGSLDSIKEFAQRFSGKLDILINNAGVMACDQTTTADGFEQQFGVNHVGHFLLTCLLIPALKQGEKARIVNLSSGGHRFSPVVFEDIQFQNRPYDRWASYGQSKTANILFTVALDKRLNQHGIRALAVHPGVIQTELGRHLPEEDIARFQELVETGAMKMKSIPAGAATSAYAATAPELEGQGGVYLADCAVCPQDDEAESNAVRSYAIDPENAERLWTLSEQLVGMEFRF